MFLALNLHITQDKSTEAGSLSYYFNPSLQEWITDKLVTQAFALKQCQTIQLSASAYYFSGYYNRYYSANNLGGEEHS